MAKYRFYFYLLISFILVSLISVISAVPEPQVDVLIRLDGSVFSPKTDIVDNYVVSDYLPDTLMGLVHASGNFTNVATGSNSMTLQNKVGSKTYLVYTKGDRGNIESKIGEVKSGDFEKMPNPSFGFPIAKNNMISVGLGYENIDILGKEHFGAGIYDLTIENGGTSENQNIIDLKSN